MKTLSIILNHTFSNLIYHVASFTFSGPPGSSAFRQLGIALRILRSRLKNPGRSATSFGEQLTLVRAVINLPPDVEGAVAEFGCFKGMSTVALSIAAHYSGRKLIVFDSFAGLPEPQEEVHGVIGGRKIDYKKGEFCGGIEEVRSVVSKCGEIANVEFVKGFFNETLPTRSSNEKYCLIFEDADLVESVRDVLRHAWPKLESRGPFFSHEAHDLEVCKLFFDDFFWESNLDCPAPGLAGVGTGLPIDAGILGGNNIAGRRGSCLAGIVKRAHVEDRAQETTSTATVQVR